MSHASARLALEGRHLSASLGGTAVLHEVDIALRAGRWCSVVGPNGAGKSTLLRVLAGLLPASGELRLLGRPLHTYSRRARARVLCWMGQGETAADDLTAWDVALLGRLPHRRWLGAADAADAAAVEHALRATQAWDWRDRPLGSLSGGERQRVLLARALAVEAEVLLMDEPLANLDPPHQADWLLLVRELVARGRTVLSVLHEITLALAADEIMLLASGRLVHHGDCAAPATHRALERLFDERITIEPLADRFVALARG